jgi:hypothetical protein
VLYILHHGLNELRNRAIGHDAQSADLADALEVFPGMLLNWDDDRQDMARWILRDYQSKHPEEAFDYPGHLEEDPVPDRF